MLPNCATVLVPIKRQGPHRAGLVLGQVNSIEQRQVTWYERQCE